MSYNNAVDQIFPRRLRSASVQLGALTALALTLSGCNMVSDDDCDDDRSMGPGASGGGTAVVAMAVPGARAGSAGMVTGGAAAADGTAGAGATVPDRGGFGTHLASCGG
ncbi:hypothetical protein [Micromonospora sp. LOL_023]|uniref:hypothetical protein n=1 Tax=Micromonospora sp. LOL_023 TaxID=3345418 RepID=UPI003A85D87D